MGIGNNPTNDPFKDSDGKYRTASLFIEHRKEGHTPIWTLKDEDWEVDGVLYPSLKKIYLSYDHVPECEYEFAKDHLKTWSHWIRLCRSQLRSTIQEWREELDIKRKADGIRAIIKCSSSKGQGAIAAAKYLAGREYASKRGRPSKEEVERTKRIEAGVEKDLEDDFERMNLQLVKQGNQ